MMGMVLIQANRIAVMVMGDDVIPAKTVHCVCLAHSNTESGGMEDE